MTECHGGMMIISGWWYTYPSETYEFVSWDDDIPNTWKNKVHVPSHQPDYTYIYNIIYIYSDIIKSQRLSAPFFTICAKGLMDLYTSTPKLGMGMMIAG